MKTSRRVFRSPVTACTAGSCGGGATIATGHTSCAVRADGTLACWGSNTDGQVGDGSTTDRS
ncbi:MAG: RCC1 domain-containing protein, partial [Prosthecobacter sp.]